MSRLEREVRVVAGEKEIRGIRFHEKHKLFIPRFVLRLKLGIEPVWFGSIGFLFLKLNRTNFFCFSIQLFNFFLHFFFSFIFLFFLSPLNKIVCNEQISSPVIIYINHQMSLLKNMISPSIPKIQVRCMNHQPIPLTLTLMTITTQLITDINIIQYTSRQSKLLHYLIQVMHLNNVKQCQSNVGGLCTNQKSDSSRIQTNMKVSSSMLLKIQYIYNSSYIMQS